MVKLGLKFINALLIFSFLLLFFHCQEPNRKEILVYLKNQANCESKFDKFIFIDGIKFCYSDFDSTIEAQREIFLSTEFNSILIDLEIKKTLFKDSIKAIFNRNEKRIIKIEVCYYVKDENKIKALLETIASEYIVYIENFCQASFKKNFKFLSEEEKVKVISENELQIFLYKNRKSVLPNFPPPER